jgi:hypothetical protein
MSFHALEPPFSPSRRTGVGVNFRAEIQDMPARKKAATDDDKKQKVAIKYPPYVNAYGAIPKLFTAIAKASVPPKFTQDFMESVLDMKSSSHRALLPLLKRLGFLDAANVPTEAYRRVRDDSEAGHVMAERLREAYAELFRAHEYAHTLPKDELTKKIKSLTGAADDDAVIPYVVSTFLELKKLADFDANTAPRRAPSKSVAAEEDRDEEVPERKSRARHGALGLSYTINLNLPATTEVEVFNAIFRSLKEHILDAE